MRTSSRHIFDAHFRIIDPAFPSEANDISLLVDALGEEGAESALWTNAAAFFLLPA